MPTGDWALQGPDGNVQYLTCQSLLTKLINRDGHVPPIGALAVSLFSEACQQGAWITQMRAFEFLQGVQFRFVSPAGFAADGSLEDGNPGWVSAYYTDPVAWRESICSNNVHPECLHRNFLYRHDTSMKWEPHRHM